MGLEELSNTVQYFQENIDDVGVNCIFVNQDNSRKKIYRAYNLNCDISLIKGTVIGTLKNLLTRMENCSLTEYDFEYNKDETIQYLNKSDVVYSDEIIKNISVNLDDSNTLSDATKMDNLDFIVVQLVAGNDVIKDLYLYKKYIKSSTAFNKSVKLVFDGAQPKIFDKPILTISDNIDTVLFNDEYYIISRNGFNSIFNYKEGFKKIIDNGYAEIEAASVFSEIDLVLSRVS